MRTIAIMKCVGAPERLVFFTDAVVAIALTLLVLPLTEIVPELVAAHGEPLEAITHNQPKIWSFLLSFNDARGTISLGHWIGFDNYAFLLGDDAFLTSLSTIATRGFWSSAIAASRSTIACSFGASSGLTTLAPEAASASLSEV